MANLKPDDKTLGAKIPANDYDEFVANIDRLGSSIAIQLRSFVETFNRACRDGYRPDFPVRLGVAIDISRFSHPSELITRAFLRGVFPPDLEAAVAEESQPPYRDPSELITAGLVAENAPMADILDFPVVETDHERRVTYCNEAFTRLCGWELQELKGERLGEKIQGEETEPDVVARMREALNAKKPIEVTVTNHRKDKTLYRSRVFIKPTAQGFAAVVTEVPMGLQELPGAKKSRPPVLPGAGRATETKRKAAGG